MGTSLGAVLDAYGRMIGLQLTDLAVDGCITAVPCGGGVAGRSSADRSKLCMKYSLSVEAAGIPLDITAPESATTRRF